MNQKLKLDELNRLNKDEFQQADKLPVIIVLDHVRSLNNVGSIFRSADAFRIEAIYLCGITATPPHREITKTALGATESVAWEYFEDAASTFTKLKAKNYSVLAIEQTSQSIALQDFPFANEGGIALVFGNEVDGVSEEFINAAKYSIEIPQFGTKHSFNVAVSAGIVLWEVFRKMRA